MGKLNKLSTIADIENYFESPILDIVKGFNSPIIQNLQTETLDEYKQKQEYWLDKRFTLLKEAETNVELQGLLKQLFQQNPIFFINMTGIAYNPIEGGIIPLVLFNRQVQALLALNLAERDKKQLTILKSRYVGASVFSTAYFVHSLLFKRDWSGMLISRVLELVDKSGDNNTLFSKIDLQLEYLPKWLKPPLQRKRGLIANLANNATVVGQGGKNAGRGGRATIAVVDEAAFVENADKLFAALSNTTECIVLVSTPNGRNEFARKCQNKYIWNFQYHWTADPRRDQAWYESKCRVDPPHIIAQELDLSFDGSTEGSLIQAYKLPKLTETVDEVLSDGSFVVGLDIAAGGKNDSVIAVRQGNKLLTIKPLDKGLSLTQQAGYIDSLMRDIGAASLVFDSDGVGLGFKAALDDIKDREGTLPYTVLAFRGGMKASDVEMASGKKASETFINARSEAWHNLADKINYTYDYLEGKVSKVELNTSRLIQLLNVDALLKDLSKPLAIQNSSGKLGLESKVAMAKRGLSSPDYGDALAYCFYSPEEQVQDFGWMG